MPWASSGELPRRGEVRRGFGLTLAEEHEEEDEEASGSVGTPPPGKRTDALRSLRSLTLSRLPLLCSFSAALMDAHAAACCSALLAGAGAVLASEARGDGRGDVDGAGCCPPETAASCCIDDPMLPPPPFCWEASGGLGRSPREISDPPLAGLSMVSSKWAGALTELALGDVTAGAEPV